MSELDKKSLTEQDIRTKFITPAIVAGNKSLAEYQQLLAAANETREKLRKELEAALMR